jgi:ribosomal protein S18 acetylase RimI-like enzyme
MPALAKQPMPDIQLRPGAPADVDALCKLENRVFSYDQLSRRGFRRFLASPTASLIVAECDGGCAGYALVLFRPPSPIARLYSIAVEPAVSGRGIGPLLLSAAEDIARGRGATVLRLEVHERNAAAISRYRKSGYVLFGRRAGYYDDHGNALRFEKALVTPSERNADSASPRGRPES